MSFRRERLFSLTSNVLERKNLNQLRDVFKKTLESGMHGLCFSPYMEGQKPGDQLSEEQIRRRMEMIQPYTKWIRSFSCTEGNELIPKIAKEYGLQTLVGAWLGSDKEINEIEIQGLVQLANEGWVDIAAVGNEVMYRKDMNEQELLDVVYNTKDQINGVPVGYVDAYYEFRDRPAITEACDIILANCYPFWEGCDQDYSLIYMKDMFRIACDAGGGKKVIITETGWPDKGTRLGGAFPSEENALKYFINTQNWSKQDEIEIFYFSSYDESWKVDAEGDLGAFWGIWDKDEQLKY